MDMPPALVDLLTRQEGLARRDQLLQTGISPSALRWRMGTAWRVVVPGVVATFTGSLSPRQRLIAGQLYAGQEAMLAATSAAAWHGVLAADGDRWLHFQVPSSRRARRHGFVVVHRTSRPDPRPWSRGTLLVASPARAVVDAARLVRVQDRCRAIVLEAVQRYLVRVEDLRHEVEAGPVRGSRWVRGAVAEAELRAWSVPEADLLGVLSGSAVLPEVVANPVLYTPDGVRLPTPDLWIDDVGLAVQVHSRRYHAGPAEWEATLLGDGRLAEQGIVVLAISPSRVAVDPAEVRSQIERAYLSLRGRRRPDVVVRVPHPVVTGLADLGPVGA